MKTSYTYLRKSCEDVAKLQSDCRRKSVRIWASAIDADPMHPYLVKKKVKPYGIRQWNGMLFIPVRDIRGMMHGIQFIDADGSKKFTKGTAVTGCFHSIGDRILDNKILIAEGYATAATLHQITGHAVAAAFNCNNLLPVARAMRCRFPDATLVVSADDDHATKGNPGLTCAANAARAVGGLMAVPSFAEVRHG